MIICGSGLNSASALGEIQKKKTAAMRSTGAVLGLFFNIGCWEVVTIPKTYCPNESRHYTYDLSAPVFCRLLEASLLLFPAPKGQ